MTFSLFAKPLRESGALKRCAKRQIGKSKPMTIVLGSTKGSELVVALEEAALNGLPALKTEFYDGWILRMSEGSSRRANCVVPLYGSTTPLREKMVRCEAAYARATLPCFFKIFPACQPGNLDRSLAQLQYSRDADTLVQTKWLEASSNSSSAISLYECATDEWLETWRRLSDRSQHSEVLRSLLKAISTPSAYVIARTDGQSVGCARAVVSGSIVGLFDLLVDPNHRGQGFGRFLLEARLKWGFEQGARLAYLQVMANNKPALALQRKYGFKEAYRYWYRVQPFSDQEDGNC